MRAITAKGWRYPVSPALLLACLAAIVLVAVVLVAGSGAGLTRDAERLSPSAARLLQSGPLALAIAVAAGSAIAAFSAFSLMARPAAFVAIWAAALALAEANLPILGAGSLVVRYLMTLTVALASVLFLFSGSVRLSGAEEKLALFAVMWILLGIAIHGVDADSLLMAPVLTAMLLGGVLLLPRVLRSEEGMARVGMALVWASLCIVAIDASALLARQDAFLAGRFRAWYPLPTNFANGLVLLLIPLAWAAVLVRSVVHRVVLGGAVVCGLAMIVLSGTRNAFGVAVVTALLFTLVWRRKLFVPFMISLIIAGLVAAATGLFGDGLTILAERLETVGKAETRVAVWSRAIAIIAERPVFGYGLAANLSELSAILPAWQRLDAHNAFLGLALRLGAPGALAIALVGVLTLLKALIILWRRECDEPAPLALCAALLLGVTCSGLFEENLSSRGSMQQALWALSVAGCRLFIRSRPAVKMTMPPALLMGVGRR